MDKVMKRQAGFGIVEIMIALVLSLFLIITLYSAMIGDRRSYEATRSTQMLTSKNRMSLKSMELYLQQTGFRDFSQLFQNTQLTAETTTLNANNYTWQPSQSVQGLNNQTTVTNAKANTDAIAIRFFGGDANSGDIYLCDGSSQASGNSTTLLFYISNNDELICHDSNGATVLDEGVENMQIRYGLKEGNDYRYYTANNVSNWLEVNRIQLGLLINQDILMSSVVNNNSYTVLDENIAAAGDKRLRQVVEQVIAIPNQGV